MAGKRILGKVMKGISKSLRLSLRYEPLALALCYYLWNISLSPRAEVLFLINAARISTPVALQQLFYQAH